MTLPRPVSPVVPLSLPRPFPDVPASSDLLDAMKPLTPPPRFEEAHFASYRAVSTSQKEAVQAARAFTTRVAASPSLAGRLRAWAHRLLPGRSALPPPRGLYLVGPAGTGKTHLMAAAFHELMPAVPCAFLHSSRLFRAAAHPEPLAQRLAAQSPAGSPLRALMLDEVELDDAANEARLAHFLRALTERGVALLATSNARPDEFLSRHVTGGGAHRRFLSEALAGRCETVLVRGADQRQHMAGERRGTLFVGPPEAARSALQDAYDDATAPKRWLPFARLRRTATNTAHPRLLEQLLEPNRLFIADVALEGTDDALRLLRLVDDLYTAPDAPALFFSASAPPEEWFTPEAEHGLQAGIAEKFTRTVSRLRELCAVERVAAMPPAA